MNLINEFNYLEADKVQIKIESLQKSKGSKDRKDIEILHYNELKLLEDKFTAEMELVVGEFNKRFQELEKVSKTWEEELEKKIKQDLADLTKSITDQTLNSLRSNKEYMNYVKQEELLVKALK
jgi:endonuclease I